MSIESFAVYRVAVSFNQRIMTSDSSDREAGHNAIISRPFRFLSCRN